MEQDIIYMKRALELAAKGRGYTNPNPMVGAVIVKNGKIIEISQSIKQQDNMKLI